jgi:hypothetical protein
MTRKPPARRNNSANKFCEYCGKKGHATNKHKKCTALPNAKKKYSQEDGSLLALPAAQTDNTAIDDAEGDEQVNDPTILLDDHGIDCEEADQWLLAGDDEPDLFYDAGTWDSDDSDTMEVANL